MRAHSLVACVLGFGVLAPAAGCERLLGIQDPVGGPVDAAGDGAPGDVPRPPTSSPLLLSEVTLTPNAAQMIEIVNVSDHAIDLSTYYLSDTDGYAALPIIAGVDPTDFIIRFPDKAMIAGRTAITVAIDSAAAFGAYFDSANPTRVRPTYSLKDGTMNLVFADPATAGLTNAGEPVILFQWDGVSDLVRDVDIMIVGKPAPGNQLSDKSHVPLDGPDGDMTSSRYAADVNTIMSQGSPPGANQSTKRILIEDGHEAHNGTGNGITGDDETSEDTSQTWDHAPYSAPTPNQPEAALLR
jgi:hypothetical protein